MRCAALGIGVGMGKGEPKPSTAAHPAGLPTVCNVGKDGRRIAGTRTAFVVQ